MRKDADGNITGYQSIIRDVTDKRESEIALAESEKRYRDLYAESKKEKDLYRSLLGSSPDAIVIYDKEGFPVYLNESFSHLFGWTQEELAGRQIPFVEESERETTRALLERVIKRGEAVSMFDTKRRAKDGKILDVCLSVSPYSDHTDQFAGMLVILRDVTARKKG